MPQLLSHDSPKQVWAFVNRRFSSTPMLQETFWRSQEECPERSTPRVCITRKSCCRYWRKPASKPKTAAFWSGRGCNFACFWVCSEEWAQPLCPQHLVHIPPTQLGQLDLAPRRSRRGSGTGTRFAPYADPAASRQGGLGRSGWSGRSPSHEHQQLQRQTVAGGLRFCLKVKGKAQTRIKGSCCATMEGAKGPLAVTKAEGPKLLTITLFNESPMGTIRGVLEQYIGMRDVFVGVEHR